MEEKRLIVIGAGNRGRTYSDIAATAGRGFRVVGVAEPLNERREYIRRKHGLPAERCFRSWEEILTLPRFADACVIATMDRDHFAPALEAVRKGYSLLLEKPVSPVPEECLTLCAEAEAAGVSVLVCHVLRYTSFFVALKRIVESGELGTVMHIQHTEGVGNVHQSHSFVRGNWAVSAKSSPMILQKSCHDTDIIRWLIGRQCLRVHSFGSLGYFRRENAPEGSPEFCAEGCPHSDGCPYDAVKLYYDDKKNGWFRTSATKLPSPTDDDVMKAILTTDYGRCVFKCDNDVVDHQTVSMEFEGGATADFTMAAFNRGGRTIRIMGTRGELSASMGSPEITVFDFLSRQTRRLRVSEVAPDQTIAGGHGGGDTGVVHAFADLLDGLAPFGPLDSLKASCESHRIAFAAEESRLTGKVVGIEPLYGVF
jgi:predicted dehydrogenase